MMTGSPSGQGRAASRTLSTRPARPRLRCAHQGAWRTKQVIGPNVVATRARSLLGSATSTLIASAPLGQILWFHPQLHAERTLRVSIGPDHGEVSAIPRTCLAYSTFLHSDECHLAHGKFIVPTGPFSSRTDTRPLPLAASSRHWRLQS